MTKYHKREITKAIIQVIKEMPVVVITGMRQSGKSTLLQKDPILKHRKYISLDDFEILEAAQKAPEQLLNTDELITIDEIQKAPQLFPIIKKIVDKKRIPGQFILSGSANLTLLKGVSETLAGRAVYMTLQPMNRREIMQKVDKNPFLFDFLENKKISTKNQVKVIDNKEIIIGGMPSIALNEIKNQIIWFKGYEQTYLERDVREITKISDIIGFRNLLHLTALRTSQILNQTELGRDVKMNTTTINRYFSLFEMSFLVSRLNAFYFSKNTRLIKSPKIFISDSGLASYLTGVDIKDNYNKIPFFGALFENFIFQNILSLITSRWEVNIRLFYWNIQGRYEVDFILEYKQQLIAIEIKQGTQWRNKDLKGLKQFIEKHPNCDLGILAYNGEEIVNLGDNIWVIPLGLLLS